MTSTCTVKRKITTCKLLSRKQHANNNRTKSLNELILTEGHGSHQQRRTDVGEVVLDRPMNSIADDERRHHLKHSQSMLRQKCTNARHLDIFLNDTIT